MQYIFGSFGTEYFDEDSSDIDIGWFTNTDIDWFEAMDECLLSMDEVIESLDKYDEFVQRRLLRSFRPEIMVFKELLGEYTSHCLRTVSVNVNDMTYLEGIRRTIELGYLNEEDYEFLVKLTKIRNRTAHGYNKPSEKELIEFFIKYKESFYNIYKSIVTIKNK